MSENPSREIRYERLRKAHDAGLTALTVLLARRYLADYPDHWPVWIWLGGSLMDLARYDEAEQSLYQALERCPDDQRRIPLSTMGHLLCARGDHQHAAEWYRRAIEAQPKHTAGYLYLGGTLALQGRFREAEEIHRKATEMCYEGPVYEAFFNLGLVLRAQERFEEAAECLREAIRLDPEYRVARKALAMSSCASSCAGIAREGS